MAGVKRPPLRFCARCWGYHPGVPPHPWGKLARLWGWFRWHWDYAG
jgi:hypothetical protein